MRRHKELKKEFMVSFTLAVMIPVIILELFSLLYYSDYLKKDAIKHNEIISKILSSKIEETLDNTIENLLYTKKVLETEKDLSNQAIQIKLDNLVSSYEIFNQVMIINNDSSIKIVSPINNNLLGNSLANKPQFKIPNETGKSYWSNVYLSEQIYLPTVDLSLPIHNGVLSCTIVYSTFNDLIRNLELDETAEIEIIDNNGTFIAHSDNQRVLRREYDKNYKYLSSITSNNPVTAQKELLGKEYLVTVNNIRETGWKIIIYYPMSLIYSPIIRINVIAIIVVLILLLLGVLIFQLRLKSIFSELTQFIKLTEVVSSGNYKMSFRSERFTEFNLLAENFQLMVNNIKKREDKIISLYHSLEMSMVDEKKLQIYIQSIINSMPSILIGVDKHGRITQWNQTAETITSKLAEEVKGKSLKYAIPFMKLDLDKIIDSIKTHIVIRENSKSIELENKTKYFDILIYPLFKGGEEGAVIQILDVTKKLEIQEQLNHKNRMDAIGQLAGGMAHDFNNVLGGIVNSAEVLKSPKRNLDERGLKFVDIIIQASIRAADLISKLLIFGRKGHIASTAVDLHNIIDETTEILKSTIDKKINIIVENRSDRSNIIGDSSALQNAILNLCINSSHALPNGGDIRITTNNITLDQNYCKTSSFDIEPGEYCEIEINDNGTGIPLEYLDKIYEPFFTTKEQGKGSGLGLSAVYGTVQDHRGAITVVTEIDLGTSFHIMIPCSHYNIEPIKKPEIIFTGKGTILLVDDEELIRITCKEMLKELGYDVILAENGQIAIDIFQRQYAKIDLVIMDMIMPEVNGREAFYKMKEIDTSCNVIISSGFTKNEHISELKKSGVLGFLSKPFKNYELSQLLVEVMNN
ncbi:MAG: response regulator [Spirochaetaceae bacterium]